MDLLRFNWPQRYASRLPLRELSFHVTVWRAPLVEENQIEELCSVRVPWDGKLYSPAEQMDLARRGVLHPFARSRPEAATNAAEVLALFTGGAENGDGEASALRARLASPASAFFTRPAAEDFINAAEEDCPVDPPQWPSRLAVAILRQHRRQHEPSNKMFFMWAVGRVVSPTDGGPPEAWRWEGEERVMCTIAAERKAGYFTSKPSINETHTLFVDSLHVYSFKITVSAAAEDEAVRAESAADGFIAKITKMMSRMRDQLTPPNAGRRAVLQQMLLPYPTTGREDRTDRDMDPTNAATHSHNNNNNNNNSHSVDSHTITGGIHLRGNLFGGTSSFANAPPEAFGSRFYVYGTVERCYGVAEETLVLRCQWVRRRVTRSSRQSGDIHKPIFPTRDDEDEGSKYGDADSDEYAGDPSDGDYGDFFTTQLSFAGVILLEDFIPATVHTFNTPFERQFDESDGSPLRLVVTAFSEGGAAMGPQSPVGYTALTIPHERPGAHCLRAPLWRVRPNGREFLRSVFVGGAPSLVDNRDAAPRGLGGISVRHGLLTESAGEVEVRLIIVQHGPPKKRP